MVWRVGTGVSLAGRDPRTALAWVPHSARVSTTGPCASPVVETMRLTRIIITAWSENKYKPI